MSREESAPLLPSTAEVQVPSTNEARATDQSSAPNVKNALAAALPTTRDKIALSALFIGIALFLPLTWYMVLSGNLKAMGWFSPHPPLQSFAIVAILLGITPLQPPPPSSSSRSTRRSTHQNLILGLALPALLIGSTAMIYNKYLHGAKHFTTWHSWFGLLTVGWVLIQVIVGAGSIWFGGKLFGGEENAKKVYKYHRVSGYILVTLFLITAHLAGAHSSWAVGQKGNSMKIIRVLAFWVGLPLIWLGITLRARPSKMKIF